MPSRKSATSTGPSWAHAEQSSGLLLTIADNHICNPVHTSSRAAQAQQDLALNPCLEIQQYCCGLCSSLLGNFGCRSSPWDKGAFSFHLVSPPYIALSLPYIVFAFIILIVSGLYPVGKLANEYNRDHPGWVTAACRSSAKPRKLAAGADWGRDQIRMVLSGSDVCQI